VTGATGGVGSIAIALLSKAGFTVAAATGKASGGRLSQGARRHDRGRPCRAVRAGQAAAEGTLGRCRGRGRKPTPWPTCGAQTRYGGAVAACGLAQGMDFPASVAPFILRGVSLLGIDSVMAPRPPRLAAWQRLARDLDPQALESIVREIPLGEAIAAAAELMGRQGARPHRGRRQPLKGNTMSEEHH